MGGQSPEQAALRLRHQELPTWESGASRPRPAAPPPPWRQTAGHRRRGVPRCAGGTRRTAAAAAASEAGSQAGTVVDGDGREGDLACPSSVRKETAVACRHTCTSRCGVWRCGAQLRVRRQRSRAPRSSRASSCRPFSTCSKGRSGKMQGGTCGSLTLLKKLHNHLSLFARLFLSESQGHGRRPAPFLPPPCSPPAPRAPPASAAPGR